VTATSILDEANYPRASAVEWRGELGAFVVEHEDGRLLYLGPTPVTTLAWARRRRWEANAGRRATAAGVAASVIREVGGLVLDVVPLTVGSP